MKKPMPPEIKNLEKYKDQELAQYLIDEWNWTQDVRDRMDQGLIGLEEAKEIRQDLASRQMILKAIKARLDGKLNLA